ncbi:MAG: sigma-54 dependent transcriptional regulator [Syntrophorhabdaceae bacterium]|nr:sigma-54 dependent transcriptional regulator [Syntrophorhabdaceae bacterium]
MADRILVVDDEASLRDAVGRILSAEGYDVREAGDGGAALKILESEKFEFILCDLRMPVMGGLELLREITAKGIPGTVIMMSAFGTVETAVEAMKLGAYDYISKPFMSDEILLTLRKASERERLQAENEFLRKEIEKATGQGELLYADPVMEATVLTAEKVKDYDATVLITGESGTGKEVVARHLHFGGRRRKEPFVAINCGAIPGTLLESELFGHRKGAFTEAKKDRAGLIEEANRGTLFLDEIGELPLSLQSKLLRVLQDGEVRRLGDTETRRVDVRLVAATARNLEEEVSAGRFREDLFYRLNVIRLHVPPLRERPEDIPLLSGHFLSYYCVKHGKAGMTLSTEALSALARHEWRGNVRELKNLMERCSLLGNDKEITREGLAAVWEFAFASGRDKDALSHEIRIPVSAERPDLKGAIRELERQMIGMALERTGASKPKAAELLGISHPALLYKAKEHGIL